MTLVATVAIGLILIQSAVPAAAQINCSNGQQAVEIGGEWVCVLFAGGTTQVDGRPLRVEVSGNGSYQRWCDNGAGVAPSGFGGAPPGKVACFIEDLGWWDGSDCYYLHLRGDTPQPGMTDYEEHGPDGLVYQTRCFLDDTTAGGLFFDQDFLVLAEPPSFEGGEPPVVLELWEQAVNELAMSGPEIATAPPAAAGLVRLPMWMWDEGDGSEAAAAGPAAGQSVRAEAAISQIFWDPGDGNTPIRCDQGMAYQPGMDLFDSPCRHQYLRSSRNEPEGTFQVVATTTWHLQWWINGTWDGELFLQAASAVDVQVNETQVLTGG